MTECRSFSQKSVIFQPYSSPTNQVSHVLRSPSPTCWLVLVSLLPNLVHGNTSEDNFSIAANTTVHDNAVVSRFMRPDSCFYATRFFVTRSLCRFY